ncbi:MAG: biotin--[acetyl-CoA-carboxylase] ligase [Rubrivivax sp.]|nr:biotin--[acetyl-CoA-carboxylase] ligase [Rubrivivax sp.]MDP3612101.1 biotin--[acetyl-CoA-carboxylase] ligase [Rubrivivax sp.]
MNTTPTPHLHWGAEALWDELMPLLPGISVEVLARVDSTNTRLLERARAMGGDPEAPVTRPGELEGQLRSERTPHGRRQADVWPCLLVAEDQTRGRGRLGRDWVSSMGASLTFSLSLPLAPTQWGGLSLAVGLALAEALDPLTEGSLPRIVLKWPNDLWLADGPGRGRKLGGILIETVSVGQRRMCVVGVGLNVLPQPASANRATEGLAHGYACLQELDPHVTAPQALARVAKALVQALRRFEAQGFAPLLPAYTRRDLLLGQPVAASAPAPLQGVADGVDELGALRVRVANPGTDGAEVQRVLSGEVSVRLTGA